MKLRGLTKSEIVAGGYSYKYWNAQPGYLVTKQGRLKPGPGSRLSLPESFI